MKKIVYLIFFLFSHLNSDTFSQIQVINSEDKQGISFVSITDKKTFKVFADYEGKIQLENLSSLDSIIFECIGYESKVFSGKDLISKKIIELNPKTKELETVDIQSQKGKYISKKLGVTKKASNGLLNDFSGRNDYERAVWIPNNQSIAGFLKNVNIFILDQGYPDAPFRIHIYDCSLDKKPGKELTQSNIIASGIKGNEWISVDLINERIFISENGCFVGIEWFDSPLSNLYSDTIIIKGVNTEDTEFIKAGNGVVIGAVSEQYKFSKNKIWGKKDNIWLSQAMADESKFNIPDTFKNGVTHILNENNLYFIIPCINIEVSFNKQKIKHDFEQAKKRKINRLEKVKENTFQYPQSTIKELFNSLITAFKNDDPFYVLSFLCVYQSDQLEEIIDNLEENKVKQGTYFRKSERELIISHLEKITELITEESLTKIDSHHFELNVSKWSYHIIVENGKWKINPYSYQILQTP